MPTASHLLATLVLASAFASLDAHATLVRPFSLAELVHEAHSVVRGEVVDQETTWDDTRHELYTLSWVRVDEVLSGREGPGELVVVRQIGGVRDGLERHVVGTAKLVVGDEVVLFTRTDGTFHYLVGMAQGAFLVAPSLRVTRRGLPALSASQAPMRPLAPDDTSWPTLRAAVLRLVAEARP